MGVIDDNPKDSGVAWTIKATEDGMVAIGHALDMEAFFSRQKTSKVIEDMLIARGIVGVVVMDDKKAVSIDANTGECLMLEIDQLSPLKNLYNMSTMRKLGVGIPVFSV
jgi:hypothetical protein